MIDKRKINSKLESMKYSMRKKIDDDFGKNSRRTRNVVKTLRNEAARTKSTLMKKHEEKMKHPRRKYRQSEEDKIDQIPDSMKDLNLERLSIFNKKKYEQIPIAECEAEVIGELELTDNERLIL